MKNLIKAVAAAVLVSSCVAQPALANYEARYETRTQESLDLYSADVLSASEADIRVCTDELVQTTVILTVMTTGAIVTLPVIGLIFSVATYTAIEDKREACKDYIKYNT